MANEAFTPVYVRDEAINSLLSSPGLPAARVIYFIDATAPSFLTRNAWQSLGIARSAFCRMQTSKLTFFTLCSRVPKRNAPSPCVGADIRINSYTSPSTSCKKMVQIGPVNFELSGIESENYVVTRPKFDDRRIFGILVF